MRSYFFTLRNNINIFKEFKSGRIHRAYDLICEKISEDTENFSEKDWKIYKYRIELEKKNKIENIGLPVVLSVTSSMTFFMLKESLVMSINIKEFIYLCIGVAMVTITVKAYEFRNKEINAYYMMYLDILNNEMEKILYASD